MLWYEESGDTAEVAPESSMGSEAGGEMVWGGFGEVPVNKGRTSQNSIV